MKTTNLILSICLLCLSCGLSHAQSAANDETLTNVVLSINLETNVAIIGYSVLNVTVQVTNSSSNYVSVLDGNAPLAGKTFLYLTNSYGVDYEFPWIERSDFDQTTSHQVSRSIGAASASHWPLSVKASKYVDGKELVPGHYILYAIHEAVTTDRKCHRLVSNPLGLELKSCEDSYSWGRAVDGVQLSISLDTNVVVIGATNRLAVRIKNLSTNTFVSLDADETSLSLSNGFGYVYELLPIIHLEWDAGIFLKPGDYLNKGDVKEWSLAFKTKKLTDGEEILPGTYVLQATHRRLVSNLVEVIVK